MFADGIAGTKFIARHIQASHHLGFTRKKADGSRGRVASVKLDG
jgi:hypothetical protein